MKASELRIGNWVSDRENGLPMQVVGTFGDAHMAYLDFEGNEADLWEIFETDLYPIKIDRAILIGSDQTYCLGSNQVWNQEDGEMESLILWAINGVDGFCLAEKNKDFYLFDSKARKKTRKLNGLHDLQNIFHSLTGNEMEVKP